MAKNSFVHTSANQCIWLPYVGPMNGLKSVFPSHKKSDIPSSAIFLNLKKK